MIDVEVSPLYFIDEHSLYTVLDLNRSLSNADDSSSNCQICKSKLLIEWRLYAAERGACASPPMRAPT
jgi:hypothetical protein